ncbi:MAG: MerR family transcriptional regulator [Kofleriaceae bacterium]
MNRSAPSLSPSAAASRLGVSTKALRLYEQRGLLAPDRSAAGYRTYGPDSMLRAAEIVALRALGLSLREVARVLDGDPQSMELALVAHEATLELEVRERINAIDQVRRFRAGLAGGEAPAAGELVRLLRPNESKVAFELPWPWGGELFELEDIRPINYIVGPLGSGKTRLARRLAEILSNAAFLGLERLEGAGATAALLDVDAALEARVDRSLAWLIDEGATVSDALRTLIVALEAEGPATLIVDMVEQGLDQPTQEALIAYLRQRAKTSTRQLFLMTRSEAILDLAAIGPDEAILLCPANHSPPTRVAPYPGAPGYEAVATCLASPEVRARTAGVIAWRPEVV